MKFPIRMPIVLIASLLSLASCVSSDLLAEPSGETHVIEITGLKFVPEVVDVQPGDTITWVNRDIVPHTATSNDGSWDTGTLAKNESKSLVVSDEMASAYFCKFHPSMTAKITTALRESESFKQTDPSP